MLKLLLSTILTNHHSIACIWNTYLGKLQFCPGAAKNCINRPRVAFQSFIMSSSPQFIKPARLECRQCMFTSLSFIETYCSNLLPSLSGQCEITRQSKQCSHTGEWLGCVSCGSGGCCAELRYKQTATLPAPHWWYTLPHSWPKLQNGSNRTGEYRNCFWWILLYEKHLFPCAQLITIFLSCYIATTLHVPSKQGRDATIHVWEGATVRILSLLKGGHSRGVAAVAFSGDGQRLASLGLDDHHTLVVWNWRKGYKIATARLASMILQLPWKRHKVWDWFAFPIINFI